MGDTQFYEKINNKQDFDRLPKEKKYISNSKFYEVINKGAPQEGDIDIHLQAVHETINSKSQRTNLTPNFKGLGVWDMEFWRPRWDTLFSYEEYRDYSRRK